MTAVAVQPLSGEAIDKFLSFQRQHVRTPLARFGERGCLLAARYVNSAQEIKDFAVRQDDVWIITSPKCGTTWTQEMVWLLMNDLNFEEALKTQLGQRSPFLEGSRFMDHGCGFKHEDTVDAAAKLSSPRCIKSHLHKDLLPDQLWTKKPKIIYVAREPKDAAVSYYHHYKSLKGYNGEKEYYFQCFYDDLVQHSPMWEHVLDFWKIKDEPNILFNTYEEMKEDLPAIIRRTAKFLGKATSDEGVTRLSDHLDIKRMKQNSSVNQEDRWSKMRERGLISEDDSFIRKGVVGEGLLEMSKEMAAKFDSRTRDTFASSGNGPWTL